MKKLILVIALGFAAIAALPVQAATATGQFDVTINLTSACKYVKTSDVAFDYTSFQTGAQAHTTAGGFTIQCTKDLAYTLALDSTSVTDQAVDLAYTLALSAAGGTGTGATQAYSVTGSMIAGQAGKCAAVGGACSNSTSTNKTRTLTITY
jgi:spore coat protein U-like protein